MKTKNTNYIDIDATHHFPLHTIFIDSNIPNEEYDKTNITEKER